MVYPNLDLLDYYTDTHAAFKVNKKQIETNT